MNKAANILIVEDEKDISEILQIQLSRAGYRVDIISDGQSALDSVEPHDLYLLDRMLPKVSGLDICKFLRRHQSARLRPILLVTALTSPEQIIEGLDAGADDYITKPFDINVLMARVRSLLRRGEQLHQQQAKKPTIFEMGQLKLDSVQCKTWIGSLEIDLTLSEYKLLHTFLTCPGKVLTRNQLIEAIQEGPVHVVHRTIDTHIFGLRKKLKDHAKIIETIRGIGYRVVPHL